jgi:2-polyprenyl-3-methyl-5-hydroxy-6-metoxy-1,4-benzoquinol methylase
MQTQSIESQREFYDARWAAQTYANQLQMERTIAILTGLRQTRLTAPRILDLGCGSGWLTSILSRFGPTVGLDLSPGAIESARVKYPGVFFGTADLSAGFRVTEKFDVIVSHEVIEHLEDQAGHLRDIALALRPNGWLILTTPNAARPSEKTQPIENHLTKRQLRSLLAVDFDIARLDTIVGGNWRKPGKHLFALAQHV